MKRKITTFAHIRYRDTRPLARTIRKGRSTPTAAHVHRGKALKGMRVPGEERENAQFREPMRNVRAKRAGSRSFRSPKTQIPRYMRTKEWKAASIETAYRMTNRNSAEEKHPLDANGVSDQYHASLRTGSSVAIASSHKAPSIAPAY